MEKFTIKIAELPHHIKGYGNTTYPSKRKILSRIVEEFPSDYRYIDHFVYDEFEEDESLDRHIVKNSDIPPIPRGTLHIYAEVVGDKR